MRGVFLLNSKAIASTRRHCLKLVFDAVSIWEKDKSSKLYTGKEKEVSVFRTVNE
jgi:hypothetical protein